MKQVGFLVVVVGFFWRWGIAIFAQAALELLDSSSHSALASQLAGTVGIS